MSSVVHPGHWSSDFPRFLANALPAGTKLRVHHVSTPPTPAAPIYASLPNQPDEATTCESHFLGISQTLAFTLPAANLGKTNSLSNNSVAAEISVLVFGIEVLVFTTSSLTTIFVSKADSSGLISRPQASPQGSSVIRTVTTAFLEWLVLRNLSPTTPEARCVTWQDSGPPNSENEDNINISAPILDRRRRRLVISLFARSQNQYLFPGSIENPTKHVLDDRQLIRWWCRVLDELVQKDWCAVTSANHANVTEATPGAVADTQDEQSLSTDDKLTPQAYVIVPGCDHYATARSFFPSSARTTASGKSRWHSSYPVDFLVGHRKCGSETALPVRCVIPRFPDDPKARYCEELDAAGIDDQGQWRGVKSLPQFWETMEYRQECASGRLVGFIWVTFGAEHDEDTPATRISAEQEADTASTPQTATTPLKSGSVPINLDLQQRPEHVTLTAQQYNILADYLINNTDFGGLLAANKSTQDWVAKVKELSSVSDFGVDVEGIRAIPASANSSAVAQLDGTGVAGAKHARTESNGPPIKVLTGVRKKRKVEEASNAVVPVGEESGKANGTSVSAPLEETEGVRTLSAGLVRKQPKKESP